MKANQEGYIAIATLIFLVSITVLLGSLMVALQQNVSLSKQHNEIQAVKTAQEEALENAFQKAWAANSQRTTIGSHTNTFFYTEVANTLNLNVGTYLLPISDSLNNLRVQYGISEKVFSVGIEESK